nr:penicillin acylase family protein [Actinomycetota bacterium]
AQGPAPAPFRADDFGGFMDILPPGANGTANPLELGAFLTTSARPPNNDDQLGMYGDLAYAVPGVTQDDVGRYFKDSSFGVRPNDVARTYSPRDDVTIVRDRSFGVPHVYGRDRLGAMFGLGYAGAEDRLFFMDVLRNSGRGRLSSFAGGAAGNRAMDADQWAIAPYTEADLKRQYEQFDDLYGEEGRVVQRDVEAYVAGVNRYIAEARLDPTKLPGEYAAILRPGGPEPWRVEDVIATASLVGGIFGKGGGREITQGRLLRLFEQRFGERRAERLWREWSAYEDEDAPTTLEDARFPYQVPSQDAPDDAVALWDEGTLSEHRVRPQPGSGAARSTPRGASQGLFGPGRLLEEGLGMSNALLVHRTRSQTGRPLAVFGPQTGYFSPQILMEQDVHAPASASGPAIDARGAAFPGVNLYVQLGRGQDYAWSATSAGQDIVDVFALPLCEPGGGEATRDSMHYAFRGRCEPVGVLRRENSWSPTVADQTPPGSETLTAQRTKLGLVVGRAEVDGEPVLYTQLRSTYNHEVDSALGFKDFNDPASMRNAGDFQRAAHKVGYTFNWFYVDNNDIAYFNSGWNPQRPEGIDGQLPTPAKYAWEGYDPATGLADLTPFAEHPRQVNGQRSMTSWNNKQAEGYAGADSNVFSSVYRSDMLDQEIRVRTRDRRTNLYEMIDAAQLAGLTDLRAEKVMYWALRLVGDVSGEDPALRDAVARLRAWQADGSLRRDADRDGQYEHTEAIRILDAWWPLWMEAQFEPVLGEELFGALTDAHEPDNEPNNGGGHLGSAYQNGWYGYAYKNIRTILRRDVEAPYGRRYCGDGSRGSCREVLLGSLREALEVPASELYGGDPQCEGGNDVGFSAQMCFDAVLFRPTGGITQPLIHWVNRPTYQQAVEVVGHRPR